MPRYPEENPGVLRRSITWAAEVLKLIRAEKLDSEYWTERSVTGAGL